ncbi:T9SS type A sorting domain-containing protein [Ekhidna sp. To15]|uniref:T9SS type A sorting domain-containing protein n=1 Tax=Ekhidna sp. To15 TaxID=3395267 RepID=UPI003F528AC3
MKKLFPAVISLSIVVGAMFILQNDQSEEKSYLNHISELKINKLDGPEKSVFRDVLMTMNPQTGEIPIENLRGAIKNQRGRVSNDRDFMWEQINTDIAGRARAIMVDPNDPAKLWLGAVTGGLWYNPDFKNNDPWVPVSDDWETLSISSITFDPNSKDIFYVGTGESFTSVNIYRESTSKGAGIYKSTDGGSTWSLLSSTSEFQYVNDIVVRDEDGTSVIYAGVASGVYQGSVFGSSPSDGLYRSADGGSTWTQVLPNIEGSSVPYTVSDIELTEAGDLYVGSMRNLATEGGGVILYSTDGINWDVDDSYAVDIVEEFTGFYDVMPGRVRFASGGTMVYAVATGGLVNVFDQIRDFGFFTRMKYKDGEGDWQDLDGPPSNWASIPWHALAMGVDPNDDDHLVIGGLNVHALSNAREVGSLSWVELSDWASMYHFSDYLIPYYGLSDSDSIINHFVHADVHSLVFAGSSDELVASTDGGVQYTSDLTKGFATLEGQRLDAYPSFSHINNSLATTQYYTVALRPNAGNNEVLAGSQDNSTHTSETGSITYESMIGGGDGAYCFFDSDDSNLRITSSQVGNYNFFIGDVGYFYGVGGGTFINPADYDDRSNLIYSNLAVDGGFEALSTSLAGRYLDSIAILNVNPFLEKDDLDLDTLTYVKLGTNTTTSFSSVKVSPHSDELDATVFLGNQLGDIFKITGLPYAPVSTKIDNDQLPVGYISSIDIGDSEDDILVTFSNYGVTSVWYSKDGGDNWESIERNLPDIPVRHGVFNPLDDQKILLATELGIWGLENISDDTEEWQSYNEGFPNVRVDMIDVRGVDSVIVAATHGRGLFLGKFNQGDEVEAPLAIEKSTKTKLIYPNPTFDVVAFNFDVKEVNVYSLGGVQLIGEEIVENKLDLSSLPIGIYFLRTISESGVKESFKVVKK